MASGMIPAAGTRSIGGLEKIALIVKREYLERVRTKWFIVSTILVPVFLGGTIFLPMMLARMATSKPQKIAVLDETRSLYADLDTALSSDPETDFVKSSRSEVRNGAPEKVRRYQLREVKPGEAGRDALLSDLSKQVEDESLDAYLVIPPGIADGSAEPTYYGRTVTEFEGLRRVGLVLTNVMVAHRLSGEGIDPSKAKALTKEVHLETVKIGAKGKAEKKGFVDEWLVTMMFVMFLYMNLILYGSALARTLIEEKTNRVVEVLLSSVKPFELMAGKILGVGAAGLTQFLVWAAAGLALSMRQRSFGGGGGEEAFSVSIQPETLLYFVLYFLLGYFLYAALFCIVGASCTTEQEAQAAQQPVVMLLVVPLIIALMIVRQPGSALSVAMSHFPFFSPIVMFMRINILTPPLWEILLNVAVILITTVGVIWIAGRIFRVGILMTGKRATIPELVRWLKAS